MHNAKLTSCKNKDAHAALNHYKALCASSNMTRWQHCISLHAGYFLMLFMSSTIFFFKKYFYEYYQCQTISYPDQNRLSVGPDLGPANYKVATSKERDLHTLCCCTIWAVTRKNLFSGICEQHWRRPACTSAVWSAPLLFTYWKAAYLDMIWA